MKITIKREQKPNLFGILSSVSSLRAAKTPQNNDAPGQKAWKKIGLIAVLFFLIVGVQAQTARTLSGIVVDINGVPLPGVSVVVKGTTQGTITNVEGKFIISVNNTDVLVFSFVGMKNLEKPVDGRSSFTVVLEEEFIGLEEVIAVGYNTIRKADLTGSVATVSSEEIQKNSFSNVMIGLQGRIPGVQITTDGNPVGDVGIQIRGLTSMESSPPLIVVDNLPTILNLPQITFLRFKRKSAVQTNTLPKPLWQKHYFGWLTNKAAVIR